MHKVLKIAFVLDDTIDTPDGVQQYVLTLGAWLTAEGHEVHYLVGESKRTDISNVHSLARNVKVRFNKNRLSIPLPTNKKKIEQILEKLDLDVLHVQMPYSPLFAGRVVRAAPAKTKIIGTFHIVPASWLQSAGARSLQLLTKNTLKKFTTIVSVSTAAQDFAKTVFNIESDVVPNVVNTSKLMHRPIYNTIPTIVFLGRLVERKGCMHLLKAIKQLQKQYTGEYQIVIGGKGPLAKKLNEYAKKHLDNNVRFLGFISEEQKPEFLAGADIAVFPSTGGESFGIVLIEAMAAGSRVVLGGNNIGYASVLSEHPDLLVDPKDSQAFANRLQHFLEFKKARIDASIWAKEAVKQYDVAVVGKKIVKIYEGAT
jgi:phosphatidyl-myo-inositol alpha-mannosyltransferase